MNKPKREPAYWSAIQKSWRTRYEREKKTIKLYPNNRTPRIYQLLFPFTRWW